MQRKFWIEGHDMDISEITTSSPEFLYRLLSRMQSDCLYYLGNGGHCARHLWAGEEREQIKWMRTIYRYLCDTFGAPEWIDEAEITAYAEQMLVL